MILPQLNIAVIGLGYVGLPLATEFSKLRPVLGFDINPQRIAELLQGIDSTLEVTSETLKSSTLLRLSHNMEGLKECNCFIITVPTPIDDHQRPDLDPLLSATRIIGSILKPGDIVIYESTVYPGATEQDCVPVLEQHSQLIFNKEFFVGYSPERINPGDEEHKLNNITKIVSGSNPETLEIIDQLYSSIILAGTYRVSSIQVAEAAKVIENTQRDLNIALINELAIIFNKLGIDTEEVLLAAGTKWNFIPFRPGLVGGHCIGVDPYYLTYKAQSVGYEPEIILAGRRINDGMGKYIASELVKAMLQKDIFVKKSTILILGVTFKENCPDTRNTRVIDIIEELEQYGARIDCYDPWVDPLSNNNFNLQESLSSNTYDAIILAVSHDKFKDMGVKHIRSLGKDSHIIYDLKYLFPIADSDLRL